MVILCKFAKHILLDHPTSCVCDWFCSSIPDFLIHEPFIYTHITYMVQEFLALPRADAIHLLLQYNGNAETVIQQIFSQFYALWQTSLCFISTILDYLLCGKSNFVNFQGMRFCRIGKLLQLRNTLAQCDYYWFVTCFLYFILSTIVANTIRTYILGYCTLD